MRPEDLIPSFMSALEYLNPDKAKSFREDEELAPVWAWLENTDEDMPEDVDYFLNELLWQALDNLALPYFYFGAHPGDGADYGFWLCEDVNQMVKDNGGLVVSDLEEVPADYSGEVLHVNDHGNATLYAADNGKLNEVWSAV